MHHAPITVLASKQPALTSKRSVPSAHAGAPSGGYTLSDLSPLAIGGAGAVYCLFTGRWFGAATFVAAGLGATALRVPDAIRSSIDPCYKARDASGKCWAMPSNTPSGGLATGPAPVR